MTKAEVMKELQSLGSEATKAILSKHGAREPFFGVKVEDLKKVMKKIKDDQQLAMELYETGNSDAMYLAGLVADGSKMTRNELQAWVEQAIAAGGHVPSLTAQAVDTGKKIGIVEADMGGTACKVPFSPDYIQKMKDRDTLARSGKRSGVKEKAIDVACHLICG